MKALQRNIILTEIGESIKREIKLIQSLRKKAIEQDLIENIKFSKGTLIGLRHEYKKVTRFANDETKETFEEMKSLDSKYYYSKKDTSLNYMM